jgi:hypothetical protein
VNGTLIWVLPDAELTEVHMTPAVEDVHVPLSTMFAAHVSWHVGAESVGPWTHTRGDVQPGHALAGILHRCVFVSHSVLPSGLAWQWVLSVHSTQLAAIPETMHPGFPWSHVTGSPYTLPALDPMQEYARGIEYGLSHLAVVHFALQLGCDSPARATHACVARLQPGHVAVVPGHWSW